METKEKTFSNRDKNTTSGLPYFRHARAKSVAKAVWCRERRLGSGSCLGENAHAGGGDAVPRGLFDQVHGLVGQVQQLSFRARIGGIRGDADARGDIHVDSSVLQPNSFANQLMQAARDTEGIFLRRLRQQHNEFVAAIPEGEVDQAALVFDGLADFAEQLRAHQVAVRIVNVLEMIEVDEDQGKLERIAMRAVDFRVEHEIQMTRVVERGAIVRNRELVNPLDVPGILDGDG